MPKGCSGGLGGLWKTLWKVSVGHEKAGQGRLAQVVNPIVRMSVTLSKINSYLVIRLQYCGRLEQSAAKLPKRFCTGLQQWCYERVSAGRFP